MCDKGSSEEIAPDGKEDSAVSMEEITDEMVTPRQQVGRPRKVAGGFSMRAWLTKNRPDLYKWLGGRGCKVWCVRCDKSFRLQRSHPRLLLLHETRMHGKRRTGPGCSTASPCQGIDVRSEQFGISTIQETMWNWFHSGCLTMQALAGERKDISDAVLFKNTDTDALHLKSKRCSGIGPHCKQCCSLADSASLREDVSKWSFRLDLFEYASSLLFGNAADQKALQEQILARDYYQRDLAGHAAEILFAAPVPYRRLRIF